MFWNRTAKRWEHHPDCACKQSPCVCRWLRPLDERGTPIPAPIQDALRERQEAAMRLK